MVRQQQRNSLVMLGEESSVGSGKMRGQAVGVSGEKDHSSNSEGMKWCEGRRGKGDNCGISNSQLGGGSGIGIVADRLDSGEDNSEDSAVATPVSATAIRAAAREIRATAWRAAAQEKSEQQIGEKDAEWQQQYQLHREAADQQMTALEARLAVACSSPATPQVVAELEWLEEEWRRVEELEEEQQQPVTAVG